MYFVEGIPQQQIAEELRILPRARVVAMCQAAENAGMVYRVVIEPPEVAARTRSYETTLEGLARQVRERFNLKECRLVNDRRDVLEQLSLTDKGLREVVVGLMTKKAAEAVTEYFLEEKSPCLAVTYGYTTRKVADSLPPVDRPSRDGWVVAMQGVRQLSFDRFDANDIVRDVARHFGCRYACMPVPALVPSRSAGTVNGIPLVESILNRLKSSNMALLSIGTLHQERSSLSSENILWPSEDEIKMLRDRGAVGNIGGQWFNSRGETIPFPDDYDVLGLSLDDIRNMVREDKRVMLVGGVEPARLPALAVALNPENQLCNVWIGDEATAKALLGIWQVSESVQVKFSEHEKQALKTIVSR
jgi:DNA-binding transcriptional regulator LsrR (DeoR family)